MNLNRLGIPLMLLVLAFSLAVGPADKAKATKKDKLKQALDRAIDDERHARAFYEAVMKKHGEYRPFSNIVYAERRHEAALLGQYERLGLTPPADTWKGKRIDVPDTFAEACDASAVAEVRNGRLYDTLMAEVKDPEVLAVFEQLQWASLQRHLRAFRRHGNGWEEVAEKGLSSGQKRQRDKALEARSTMFNGLMTELSSAMKNGDPAKAIDVCSKRAPQIAKDAAKKHGVRIGRTSYKLRNPKNEAPVWAALLVDERADKTRFMADDNGRLGVLTPIHLAGACLKCHGGPNDLAPGVREQLAKRYPHDKATGFKEGDLRGWFWVEVPYDRQRNTAPQLPKQ